MTGPATSEHLRSTTADHPDGVYRVVGRTDEAVTLLRITDGDGRRAHTGQVTRVDRDALDGFEPVADPDPARPPAVAIRSALTTAYWSIRAFVGQLAATPLPTAVALGLVAFGATGDAIVPLPDAAFGVAILAGSLGLAYVGSGRLSNGT
jgi:hypothetical protein